MVIFIIWIVSLFCKVIICSEDAKILWCNRYEKTDKALFIIYADLEYIIENSARCKNNPENSSTAKLREHIPSSFSKLMLNILKNCMKFIIIYHFYLKERKLKKSKSL